MKDYTEIVSIREVLSRLSLSLIAFGITLMAIIIGLVFYLNAAPDNFPVGSDFVVREGMTIREIGKELKAEHFIRSTLLMRILINGSEERVVVQAGSYRFDAPMTTQDVLDALRNGSSRSPEITLTFPEGFSVYDIREYTKDTFASIDLESLLKYEGYLFPDTYFVSPTETVDDLILRMNEEYNARMLPYRDRIAASGLTEEEVIILASILEREANDSESMKIVSGILQNRLRDDLPLQVDAAFEYIIGKTSAELTMEDLSMDSPFNTYTHIGLPPTPIANPGVMAIEAVLEPISTNYYYYLTDANGMFHYARNFEEHKRNKELYLN